MFLQEFFKQDLHLSDEHVIQELVRAARVERVQKGDLIVEVGQRQTQVPLLLQGVLRGFMIDESGRDMTDCFAFRRGEAAMPCNDFDAPSQISIEAVTNSELLKISISMVEELMKQSRELLGLYNHFLKNALERHWEMKVLMYHTATQRYQWFLRAYPELVGVISNKHIASFLGMTPVTLSRLRRKLRENGWEQAVGKDARPPMARSAGAWDKTAPRKV